MATGSWHPGPDPSCGAGTGQQRALQSGLWGRAPVGSTCHSQRTCAAKGHGTGLPSVPAAEKPAVPGHTPFVARLTLGLNLWVTVLSPTTDEEESLADQLLWGRRKTPPTPRRTTGREKQPERPFLASREACWALKHSRPPVVSVHSGTREDSWPHPRDGPGSAAGSAAGLQRPWPPSQGRTKALQGQESPPGAPSANTSGSSCHTETAGSCRSGPSAGRSCSLPCGERQRRLQRQAPPLGTRQAQEQGGGPAWWTEQLPPAWEQLFLCIAGQDELATAPSCGGIGQPTVGKGRAPAGKHTGGPTIG